MDDLVENCGNLLLNLNSVLLLWSSSELLDGFFWCVIIAGDGDTPSPQVVSPKRGSEVENSPEVNLPQPEDGEENQEEMGDIDHDPTRSEGTIEYKIPNFSKISGKLLSPPVYIRDLPWYFNKVTAPFGYNYRL